MPQARIRRTIDVEPDLYDRLERLAREKGLSVNTAIVEAIRAAVEKWEGDAIYNAVQRADRREGT
jgi:predicted transcriptional regulator